MPKIKQALISVANKDNLIDFAQELISLNINILATAGTAKTLTDANIAVTNINDIPEISSLLSGRIKTLHPQILAGILCDRSNQEHLDQLHELNINCIDLVVVNFYPFVDNLAKANSPKEVIEFIDIGGPTMVRSAAKNYADVSVVIDPNDYEVVLKELKTNQNTISTEVNKQLAGKVFAMTSEYDANIAKYFNPQKDIVSLGEKQELKYGENPHQVAAVYDLDKQFNNLGTAQLSYNNINDALLATNTVNDHTLPTCAVIKHATPCGVASANNIADAITLAFAADPTSAYGGVIAINCEINKDTLTKLTKKFIEVIIAKNFTEDCKEVFKAKPNIRYLTSNDNQDKVKDIKSINQVTLIQDKDDYQLSVDDIKIVTKVSATRDEIEELLFAWKVVKFVQSNAIVISNNKQSLGIGGGQTSRVAAANIAINNAKANQHVIEQAVVASDGFFPFADSIQLFSDEKIKAIIQPGGSKRDEEVIQAANDAGIIMAFTNIRHFRH